MQIAHLQSRTLTSHSSANILHLKMVSPRLLLTASSDGELRLYRLNPHNQQLYQSIECNKLFECPIVACDIAQDGQIVVAAFSAQIKICRITNEALLVVERQVVVSVDSPITSCVWSWRKGEFVVSSELGSIYAVGTENSGVVLEVGKSKEDLVLVRRGSDRMYLSQGSRIESFHYSLSDNSFQRQSQLTLPSPILDFAISNEPLCSTLAVLTPHSLTFYLLHQPPLQTAAFEVDEKAIGSRLGWGTSYDELGLYQCIDGSVKTQRFVRLLSGKWKRDENISARVNLQGRDARMNDT